MDSPPITEPWNRDPMHLQLALICDHAAATPEGKLDIHGVFNDLFAPGFPAKQARMVLVLALEWDRTDEGRHKFKVELLDPMGKPSLTVEGDTEVDRRPVGRPPARTRVILPLEDVVFPVPGRYTFDLRVKGKRLKGPSLYLIETDQLPLIDPSDVETREGDPTASAPSPGA